MADWWRQVCAAGVLGGDRVFEFVTFHLFQDGAGTQVAFRDLEQVGFQMFDHLILRFRYKAQAPAVADQAGRGADRIKA